MIENPADWYIYGGLATGLVFGFIIRHFDLCLVSGVNQAVEGRQTRYTVAMLAAALVAIAGTQLLEISGMVDVSKSYYRDATLDWMGVLLGGFIFGYGAGMVKHDAARLMVVAAGGDQRAIVAVIMFGVFASIAQFGLLEPLRLWLTNHTAMHLAGDTGLAAILGVPKSVVLLIVLALLGVLTWKYWKKDGQLRLLIAGMLLGACAVFGWYATGVLAFDEFDPKVASSITVSGPMSRAGMMLVAGDIPRLSYAISFVIGLLLMGFAYAVVRGQWRWQSMANDSGKVILGAALMGIGGTLAYGCNIGQGYSGLSTLSLESLLAVVAMVAGLIIARRKGV